MDVRRSAVESVTAENTVENGSQREGEASGRGLDEATEKELQALKIWLFSENIRVQAEQKKLLEMEDRKSVV